MKPVDWNKLLRECKATTKRWKAIETATDTSGSSRLMYMKGVTPRYDAGERIIEYWAKKTGHMMSEVPRLEE